MAPIVEKIKNQTTKKAVLAGSGATAAHLGYTRALKFIEEEQQDSWLSYVPVPKKAIGVGAAVTGTFITSLVAAPENKKYVWIGGAVSLFFHLSKSFLPGGTGIGSGGDGGSHSQGVNTGKDNGNQTSINDGLMMQELKSSGFIDGVIKNNGYLKLSVGESLIYARVGGAFQGDDDGNDTVEIYPNEILFLISNVPELKVVEIFRLIGDQEVITNKINPIVDHVHAENKTVVVHDRPFSVWGSVGS